MSVEGRGIPQMSQCMSKHRPLTRRSQACGPQAAQPGGAFRLQ